jgi:hypothetical protein
MKRVAKLVGVVGAAWVLALAAPAAATTRPVLLGDGERPTVDETVSERNTAGAVRHGTRLDWCHEARTVLGARRATDGGERYDVDSDECGNGDAHGGPDDDGGRYADDHGRPDHGSERWKRADWGDVRFRLSGAVLGRELSVSQLASLLGRGVVSRLMKHAYEQRIDGELVGRWLDEDPRVLRVYGGRVPVAELTDRDGDERVDLLRLAYWP